MEAGLEGTAPVPLDRWSGEEAEGELPALRRLLREGVPVAPMVVVPPAAEASFYRWNRLPQRLAELFAPVASRDPDEEEVEDLIPLAGHLIDGHALLDQWVDAFYDALAPLPSRLRVRRPGEPGVDALRGRPALLALRATWRADWAYAPVLARLLERGSVSLRERPVLLHPEPSGTAPPDLLERVRSLVAAPYLGNAWAASRVDAAEGAVPDVEVTVRTDAQGAVVRVVVEPSATRPNARGPGG